MNQNQKKQSPKYSSSLLMDETQDLSMLSSNPNQRPFYNRIPCLKPLLFILLLQLLIFLTCYFFIPVEKITIIIDNVKFYLKSYYDFDVTKFLLFYFLLCFVSIACFLPTISLITILFTMITREVLFSWLITLLFYIISESLLYLLIHLVFKKRIKQYVERFRYPLFFVYMTKVTYSFYEMIRRTANQSAFVASIIIRGLYILDSLKNYTLIILDIPFFYYCLSSVLANSVYIMKNVLIGYQMTAINDLMSHRKNWGELDFTEKFFFVMVIVLIVFTFLVTGVFSFWARNKMKGIGFDNRK